MCNTIPYIYVHFFVRTFYCEINAEHTATDNLYNHYSPDNMHPKHSEIIGCRQKTDSENKAHCAFYAGRGHLSFYRAGTEKFCCFIFADPHTNNKHRQKLYNNKSADRP